VNFGIGLFSLLVSMGVLRSSINHCCKEYKVSPIPVWGAWVFGWVTVIALALDINWFYIYTGLLSILITMGILRGMINHCCTECKVSHAAVWWLWIFGWLALSAIAFNVTWEGTHAKLAVGSGIAF
jgi:hypothetical protein